MKVTEAGCARPAPPERDATTAESDAKSQGNSSLRGRIRRVPVVQAEEIPATRGSKRRLPVVVVRCCPYCEGSHLHRGLPSGLRKSGCVGLRYRLVHAAPDEAAA